MHGVGALHEEVTDTGDHIDADAARDALFDDLVSLMAVDAAEEGYTGNIGLVTAFLDGVHLRDIATSRAIVVGPPMMMIFTVQGLLDRGFQEENIWVSQERKMCCGLGKCGHCRIGEKYVCIDGPVFNYTVSKTMLD